MNIANETIDHLPEKPAVYKLYHRGKNGGLNLLYVGRTTNLRARIFNHNVSFDEFTFEIISSEEQRKAVEEYLIEEFEPPFNDRHNPSPLSFDTDRSDAADADTEGSIELSETAENLLVSVNDEPFLPMQERYDMIGVVARQGSKAKDKLLEQELVKEVVVRTMKPGRNPKLLDLTQAGKSLLQELGHDVKQTGKRGLVHRYWQQQVKEHYESAGYTATIEHSFGMDRIDVYATTDQESIAIEVACSPKYEVKNIEKCMKHDVDKVQIVCTEDDISTKIRSALQDEMDHIPDEVEFLSLRTFS